MSASSTPVATSTGSPSAIPHDIVKITFPLLFGPLINWTLYGVLCVQIYVYSYNFPDDRRIMKCLAYFIFALDTVQTALNGSDVYFWFAEGFGDVERLKDSHLAPIDIPLTHAIISLLVQEYFCYRIWRLNKRSSLFCIFIAVISVVQSVAAMWGGIKSIIAGKYVVSKAALYLWAVPSVVADILIVIAMSLVLSRARSKGGRYSNFVLVRLVRLIIETNALTATVAASAFVLYAAYPNEIYYTLPAGIIGKTYSNTLMVSLNNRIYFRDHHSSAGARIESDHALESEHSHSAIASIHFGHIRPPPRTGAVGDTFKLDTISHPIDLERGKGDSISSDHPKPRQPSL